MKYIELFAGCGGMSLGLRKAGYELVFANELSPMAAETYVYNMLGDELSEGIADNTLWLKSNYSRENITERLKELPSVASQVSYSDVQRVSMTPNKMVIGDVLLLEKHLLKQKQRGGSLESIDLLAGGPPCQSFSLAGKRDLYDQRNDLPFVFARIASIVQPKVVFLENVQGITSSFLRPDNHRHHAWVEISKDFARRGFIPVSMIINTKHFGVPQNRPRYVMLAFRMDIYKTLIGMNNPFAHLLSDYGKIFADTLNIESINPSNIRIIDQLKDIDLFDGEALPRIEHHFVSAANAIGDLIGNPNDAMKSEYVAYVNNLFSSIVPDTLVISNHEFRKHSMIVRRRYRLYQVSTGITNGLKKELNTIINGETTISEELTQYLLEQRLYYIDDNHPCLRKPKDIGELLSHLHSLPTRKRTQRAMSGDLPAPAQLTIPDDVCHYNEHEIRTLTVREMARLQSFPDGFVFKSKTTSGGKLRRQETPQYTQVGNAVPPLLAYRFGEFIKRVLEEIE
ncbi:MAG: DNA cytosine methyltransferase [Candidatus Izemoplasmatales bacterium]